MTAAAAEERFTRVKHDASLPINAVKYCIGEAGIRINDVDYLVFYEKPIVKFERILRVFIALAPRQLRFFLGTMPLWLKDKLWMRDLIRKGLEYDGEILFSSHHLSHAASAFYSSPFDQSAILTADGVGEWNTMALSYTNDGNIELVREINFPDSLGLLYSAITSFLGFQPNDSEYKVMGMAPYGEPSYVKQIKESLIEIFEDGSFRLNLDNLPIHKGDMALLNEALSTVFGFSSRKSGSKVERMHFDLARSVQEITEEVMLKAANYAYDVTRIKNLCLAGGVALNVVANGKIMKNSPFERVYVHPAAGDDGGAYGAAALAYYVLTKEKKVHSGGDGWIPNEDPLKNCYLGPAFSNKDVESFLQQARVPYRQLSDDEMASELARHIADGRVVAVSRGRMEWGPRALGNRSILADPRHERMKDIVNMRIKFREEFRPFAPTVLLESASEFFEIDHHSPYMLFVVPVREEKRKLIPAVTHVDGTARIQTLKREDNPFYYRLIELFAEQTGIPVVLNTSFNLKGEPIVCTPQDAYTCFMRSGMDYLAMQSFLISKEGS